MPGLASEAGNGRYPQTHPPTEAAEEDSDRKPCPCIRSARHPVGNARRDERPYATGVDRLDRVARYHAGGRRTGLLGVRA